MKGQGPVKAVGRHLPPPGLPRLKLRQRTRTCSSDSGVEVGCESPSDLLEDTLGSWTGRLESVVGQEMARARELTAWAREALRQAEGDEESREEVLESWRRQMEGVMEFTADLVDCVNNDTRDMIAESLGNLTSPMDASVTIEEKEEDEEKEEEIMKLFWTPCTFPPPKPSMKKQSERTNEFVLGAEKKTPKRLDCLGRGLRMFQSTLDPEDIFEDWNWNLWEFERPEDIFEEWRWNLAIRNDIRLKFYDDPLTENAWNDFFFWKFDKPDLTDTMALNMLTTEDVEATDSPDSGLQTPEKDRVNKWVNCKYWEDTFQNESILQSLLDNEMEEPAGTSVFPVNFWDESASNQATVELLMQHEDKEKDSTFLWEEKQIVFVQPPTQYFPWEDPDTLAGLLEDTRPSRRASGDSTFLWDDPAAIGMLLTDEEDETYLSCNDKTVLMEELPSTLEEVPEHTTWEQWSLWDQFGSSGEIIKVYEELATSLHQIKPHLTNIDDAFWNITLADSNASTRCLTKETKNLPPWHSPDVYADDWDHDTPKPIKRKTGNQHPDPLNTFKAFRYIFYETSSTKQENRCRMSKEKKPLYADMLDIYADWAPGSLGGKVDERIEKKRQRRGRGRARGNRVVQGAQPAERVHQSTQQQAVRRPGTPTIAVKKVKEWELDYGWIESKHPKKGRKTCSGSGSRRQRHLHAKIHAKQPRSVNAAFPA